MATYKVTTDKGTFKVVTEDPAAGQVTQQPTDSGQPGLLSLLGKYARGVGDALTSSPVGFIGKSIGNYIANNPKEAYVKTANALPAIGGAALPLVAAASTGGTSIPASIGLSGLGMAAGEAGKQLMLNPLGNKPTEPVTYPFTSKPIGKIPGLSQADSNLIEQFGVGSTLEGVPRGIGVIGKNVGPSFMRGTNKVREWITGKDASEFSRLAKDPTAILPSFLGGPPSKMQAGSSYADALKVADIEKTISPADPKNLEVMTSAWDKISKNVPHEMLIDAKNGELAVRSAVKQLSPQEAFTAWQSTKAVIKGMVKGKEPSLFRNRVLFQNALRDHLIELAPAFGEKVADFARASLRSSLTDILPSTKYGIPSIGRAGFARMIGLPLALTSPLVQSATVLGQKGIGSAISNPTAVKTLSEIIKRMRNNK